MQPHLLQSAWPEVLDQAVRRLNKLEQYLPAAFAAQIERETPLVAAVFLPVKRYTRSMPLPERISIPRILYLYYICAKIRHF
ncbi:hypothetical protein GCM10007923_48610 [Shinella yambaruensis]|uniref:Uncharacterized protein n=1 Tax=Shinella yambaruensis TaxID=415996 RepID=A0ABQ5ZPV0_9HYPH|nr:hypothetical protein GCM10007923_48610 [Shinella yambaruensis]